MPATKRKAEEPIETSTARSSKSMKMTNSDSRHGNGASKKKKSTKAPVPTSEFLQTALPMHVNITHTPPVVPSNETETVVPDDPGFIGTLALVPSTFSTGSYGWKGNKKITVEFLDTEKGGNEKAKVEVMLSINATVVGSKLAEKEAAVSTEGEADGGNGGEEGYESDNDDGGEAQGRQATPP